jgi:SnoaL-like domain
LNSDAEDRLAILELVQNWAIWRDAGDWERFRTVWHDDGWMTATWFQGPAEAFIEITKTGFESGVSILHLLGGSSVELKGDRAICQTRMTISQRAPVDGVLADVSCIGRFYDFIEKRAGRWGIVRRQPIYEKDRLDPVDPSAHLKLDTELLESFPEGFRHLAYLQTKNGFTLKHDLPGLHGPIVERLYTHGRAWLDGAPSAFPEGERP